MVSVERETDRKQFCRLEEGCSGYEQAKESSSCFVNCLPAVVCWHLWRWLEVYSLERSIHVVR